MRRLKCRCVMGSRLRGNDKVGIDLHKIAME